MKKSAKVLIYFGFDCGMLELFLIFGARFGGKDPGLSTCKP
jgi:hypothetical protein